MGTGRSAPRRCRLQWHCLPPGAIFETFRVFWRGESEDEIRKIERRGGVHVLARASHLLVPSTQMGAQEGSFHVRGECLRVQGAFSSLKEW